MISLLGSIKDNKWLFIASFVLFVLLFIDVPFADKSRSFNALWNLGHILLFAFFARILFVDNPFFDEKSFYSRLILCLLFATIVGVIIELLQYGLERDMDMEDVFRDITGALVGFFFSPLVMAKSKKYTARIGVTILLVCQLIPLANALVDEHRARTGFPVLSDFESDLEITRWRGEAAVGISDEQATSGKKSLRVETDTGKYSGISLVYFPSDWSTYQSLILEVYTSDDDLDITVRVHDREHRRGEQRYNDRFNRKYTLLKGWNTIVIDLQEVEAAPATRKLNLSDVHGMGVFVTRQSRPRVLYLDGVKLI